MSERTPKPDCEGCSDWRRAEKAEARVKELEHEEVEITDLAHGMALNYEGWLAERALADRLAKAIMDMDVWGDPSPSAALDAWKAARAACLQRR